MEENRENREFLTLVEQARELGRLSAKIDSLDKSVCKLQDTQLELVEMMNNTKFGLRVLAWVGAAATGIMGAFAFIFNRPH